jgi:hypothetical protein
VQLKACCDWAAKNGFKVRREYVEVGYSAFRHLDKRDTFKELLAEAAKRGWEPDPVSGEKLEALAREVVTLPPEVIARMNVVLGK